MRSNVWRLGVGAAMLGVLIVGCGGRSDRTDVVRETGQAVMPFDLEKTKHSFVKTDDGGVQTVISLDPTDTEQVRLVRGHLLEIREEFSAGRFNDPTTIHGADMPGVATLTEGADRITFTYRDVDGGGEIMYRTDDGALVGAIHTWFDAQIADHGEDAVSVPFGHVMTEEMWRNHHPGEPYPGSSENEK